MLYLLPILCAFVGWVTNVVAIKMIFHPRNPIRIGPLVYQGLFPKNKEKFARLTSRNTVQYAIMPSDIIARLDPDDLAEMVPALVDEKIDYLLNERFAELKDRLGPLLDPAGLAFLKKTLTDRIVSSLPGALKDLEGRIDEMIDLQKIVYDKIMSFDVMKLEDLFMELSKKEIRWIEYYGGILGFMVGSVQLVLGGVAVYLWVIPIVCAVVGWFTNFLALKMIFYPYEPKKYLFITYQGVVPKRKVDISRKMASVIDRDLVATDELVEHLEGSRLFEGLPALVRGKLDEALGGPAKAIGTLLEQKLGPEDFDEFKDELSAEIAAMVPGLLPLLKDYLSEKVDIMRIGFDKLGAVSMEDYVGTILEAFEDEMFWLEMYGGLLGLVIGLVQVAVLVYGR